MNTSTSAVCAPEHHDVIVIGAGFSAIAITRALLAAGVEDFVVLEKASQIGGTWRDNTYPGCRCDVESILYSFSFAPNPDWTELYATQPEIWDYLISVASKVGMIERTRLDCPVRAAHWDEAARHWVLSTGRGEFTARILINAGGPFNEPHLLRLPGRDEFAGQVVHTARWPADLGLTGKRVVVIGTGASAVQVVPAIQPLVGHLTVIQRTPAWVTPHRNALISPVQRSEWRQHPQRLRRRRQTVYRLHELIGYALGRKPGLMRLAERPALRHLEEQVHDTQLRAALTPDYRMGCKRITPSNDFYPALTQPNVSLVPYAAVGFSADGVLTADGSCQAADVVVMATGFDVTIPPSTKWIVGRDGSSMSDFFNGHPHAYLGTTVPGFPNLFTVLGPNTGQGHTSVLLYQEAQADYIAAALRWMSANRIEAIDVDPDIEAEFNDDLQRRLRRSVWATGGCSSWYQDETGAIAAAWPRSTDTFVNLTRSFDPSVYRLTRARF